MEQYISKSALVAEINRNLRICAIMFSQSQDENCIELYKQKAEVYQGMLSFLDTLEVKEVDLEKHLKEDIKDVFFDLSGVAVKGATHYLTVEDVKDIAKHFFELGLKVAQKGE